MTNTLYDALIGRHAENDAPFLTCDDGRIISFRQFVARASQMAHVLVAHGVGPGDRVLVHAPKLDDTLALYAATIQAGAVYLPLNTAYTQAELEYFAEDAAPKLIVCDARRADDTQPLANKIGAALLTLSEKGGTLSAKADDQPTDFETIARGPDDLAGLLYTSGTTGRSKGAMLSHKNLLSNAQVLTAHWQMMETDALIRALPIFHTHGLFVALNTSLLAGAKVRFMAGFDLDAILEALPQATLLMGVPTFYTRFLNDPRFDRTRTENMRLFISGSAPLLAETHEAFEARTGHRILERYGMTETNMITSNPFDGDRRAGTVGRPLPGVEVMLTNPDSGGPTRQGDVGMIEVRGPNVFQGYWQMPEKTAAEKRENGFFITGDLGQISNDGYLSIVGRAKDLIITGGYNVYPKEIEDVLNQVVGVQESAVFGVPDPDFGEAIIAAVVPTDDSLDDAALSDAVTAALARFKHPRQFVRMEDLPRNTMGKVQKNVLREQFSSRSTL